MSEKSVSDLVVGAIDFIRNKRKRPSLNAIFEFVIHEKITLQKLNLPCLI